MKVTVTGAADDSLWQIYLYYLQYSESYADQFQEELDRFLTNTLSQNPLMGKMYHAPRNIRRLVYLRRYNVYYITRNDVLFILFIFDGRMQVNQDIAEYGLDTDSLID